MLVINALVYKSRKEGKIYVEDYELNLISDGNDEENAKIAYLELLETQIEIVKKHKAGFLAAHCDSERCKRGLERIALSKRDYQPDIKRAGNIEVHFYKEIR
jgi:hypothetical protein